MSLVKYASRSKCHTPKVPRKKPRTEFLTTNGYIFLCQVTTRRILSSSKNPDIRKLYLVSSAGNVNSDEIVEQAKAARDENVKKQAKELQKKQIIQSTWSEFLKLKKENIKFLTENVPLTRISSRKKVVKWLPDSIFYSFSRRYLILALPTKCNLKTWNMIQSDIGCLCNKKSETFHHIVSNCEVSANEGRYTWRHNSVLYTIWHISTQ